MLVFDKKNPFVSLNYFTIHFIDKNIVHDVAFDDENYELFCQSVGIDLYYTKEGSTRDFDGIVAGYKIKIYRV